MEISKPLNVCQKSLIRILLLSLCCSDIIFSYHHKIFLIWFLREIFFPLRSTDRLKIYLKRFDASRSLPAFGHMSVSLCSAPPPPKRAPTTALSMRSKSMTSELEELGKSCSFDFGNLQWQMGASVSQKIFFVPLSHDWLISQKWIKVSRWCCITFCHPLCPTAYSFAHSGWLRLLFRLMQYAFPSSGRFSLS